MGANFAVGAIQSVIFAKVLSPSSYGLYGVAMTVAAYGSFLQFGLISGLSRELPWELGRGDTDRAARLVGQCTTLIGGLAGVCYVLFAAAVWTYASHIDRGTRTALLLGAFVAAEGALWQIGNLRLRAEQRIIAFPVALLIQKIAIVALGIVAARSWGFAGPIVIIALVEILVFVCITKYFLSPARYFPIDRHEILYLARIGFPLMAAGALDGVILGLDRMFLVGVMASEDLGIYYFSALPVTIGVAIASVVSQYLSPKLIYDYGRDGSLQRLYWLSVTTDAVIMGVMALGWPVFNAAAHYAVRRWLPAYQPSLTLMPIFYIGGTFAAARSVGLALHAVNRQSFYLLSSVIVGILALCGYSLLVRFGAGLQAYAAVATGALGLGFFLHLVFGWHCTRVALRRPARAAPSKGRSVLSFER